MNLMKLPTRFLSWAACSAEERTCAVPGTIERNSVRSMLFGTPDFAATEIAV